MTAVLTATRGTWDTRSQFSFDNNFTVEPEHNLVRSDRTTPREVDFSSKVNNPEFIEAVREEFGEEGVQQVQETGRLTFYFTADDAAEIDSLESDGWNVAANWDGWVGGVEGE